MVSQISGKFTYLNDGTTAHLGVGPAVQDAGQKRPVREMPSDAPWTALGVCGIKRRGLATLLIFTATVSSTCSRVVSAPVVWTRGGQHLIRGGQNSSPVEPNPNYRIADRSLTLGDLEERQLQHRRELHSFHNYESDRLGPSPRPRPLNKVIMEFFISLHRLSQTLYYGSLSAIAIFFLWQVSPLSPVLSSHFVCSRQNVLQMGRLHATILSAISHASFTHLLMNLYGLLTFGPSVCKSLASVGLPLWPFAVGSAACASAFFLLLSPSGGCLGLSGVTLAMLAFHARAHPSRELGFVISFIPIRMPAEYALSGIFIMSLFGAVMRNSKDNVAHAAHLGGLCFGVAFFELFTRGWLTSKGPWLMRWDSLKRTYNTGR